VTTLAAGRLVAVRGGRSVVDGVSLEVHDGQVLRRDRVALVFQGYGLLRDAADRAAAAVGATHDPEVVELCDRVVRLVDGRPLELTPGEVGEPVA